MNSHLRTGRRPLSISTVVLVGALVLGCSPEPPTTDPEPVRRAVTPATARATLPRVPRRPTVPAPVEPVEDDRFPAPAADQPPPEEPRPVAVDADAVPDIGKAPLRVQFEARVDAGADSYVCDWDFGDGNSAIGNPVEHEFTAPGSYTTRVRVTTSAGATGSYEVGVEVDAPVEDIE